ncbi:transposase [Streptomyces sp. 11x1]|uniref:transposase n=1 Tax=Streptomyces sp. 11x1 TaxID=3038642 RepID=UPI0037DA0DA3
MSADLSQRLVPDGLWELDAPLLPSFNSRPQGGGTAPLGERAVFTAVVYVLTGRTRHPGRDRLDLGDRGCRVGAGERGGSLTGPNSVDRGKKGSKLHVLSETQGLPLAVVVSGANMHDGLALKPLLRGIPAIRSRGRPSRRRPVELCVDKTPHAAFGSSSCREWSWGGGVEGDRFVELLAIGQTVVELAEHTVEQMPEGRAVVVAGVPSAVVVVVCAGGSGQ